MKKYRVMGPRILIKVPKFDDADSTFVKGGSIVMPSTMTDQETQFQTIGEVVQIGPTVKSLYDGFEDLKVGDLVHFQRYGAQRINVKEHKDIEYWVINGKDVLVTEEEAEDNVNI